MPPCTAFIAPQWVASFRAPLRLATSFTSKRPRAPPSSHARRPPFRAPFRAPVARGKNFQKTSSSPSAAQSDGNEPPSDQTSSPQAPSLPPAQAPQTQSVPISIGPLSFTVPTRALLYIVPFLWGSFAPAVRFLFAQHPQQPPAMFNSERLLLSTLLYLPILIQEYNVYRSATTQTRKGNRFAFLGAGIELGVYVFLANIAQVIGLKQTSAARAAFLVQLQTVFVPVLGTVLGVDSITFLNGLSSVIAVAGVALLASDKSSGTASTVTGDALEVLSAIFFTAYVVRLGKFCKDGTAGNPLVAVKIATQALFSIGWSILVEFNELTSHGPAHVDPSGVTEYSWTASVIGINILVVAWTGLVSSAFSGWAQTKGQQAASPSEAVLIFATQPLWATALAAVVLGESFGTRGFAGGLLIVGATLVPTVAAKLGFGGAGTEPVDAEEEREGR